MPPPKFLKEPRHWLNYRYWWGACKYEDANAIVKQVTGLSLAVLAIILIVIGLIVSEVFVWIF